MQREIFGVWMAVGALALACGSTKSERATGEASTGGAAGVATDDESGSTEAGGTDTGGAENGGTDGCEPGTETCPCYGNGTCNDGLTCASNLCVVLPGSGGTPGGGTGGAGTEDTGGAGGTAGGAGATDTGSAGAVSSGAKAGASGAGAASSGATAGTGATTTGGAGGEPAACTPEPDATGCVGTSISLAPTQLALYFMFDVSCSMSCSVDASGCCDQYNSPPDARIVPVREALRQSVESEASAGVSVGLGFFGDHDSNDLSLINSPELCSVEAHSDATVAIAPLPGNATTFVACLNSVEPQGGTPTQFAILGACAHISEWHAANPAARPVVVLVTDGIPEHSCNATFELAIAAAESCFDGGAGYQTYVLGIDSNNNGLSGSLDQLNAVATAAGTEQAYLTDPDDIEASTLNALDAILAATAERNGCSYSLDSIDAATSMNRLNVGICDEQTSVVPRVESYAACGSDPGWFFDDPVAPTRIHLCPNPCDAVISAAAELFFTEGCQTLAERW